MDWFRWHHGTVSDPKLKLIAQRAGRPLTTVIAVWAAMEERASENDPRGTLEGWDPEVMAAGLDIQPADVVAIYEAMQGKTLEADELRAWRKRQPRREDDSTERVRAHRAKKEPEPVDETHSNAVKRDVTLDKRRVEKKRNTPPAAGAAAPPAAAMEAMALLGNGGAEALQALGPPGGIPAALTAIRSTLLYENENEAMPDESVKGLSRVERRQLVARALMEMQAAGKGWNSASLAGFVRNIRAAPARAGPQSRGTDPWAM